MEMLQEYIKPPRLEKGDTIGIVSPSSTIEPFPLRTKRAVKALTELGFNVLLGSNSQRQQGEAAGTPQERADDIHTFISDPGVKAIMASTGGYNTNSVLPLLDYELIREHPKIICGYSDITALNMAVLHKSGVVTFNGPSLLPTFGEFGGAAGFTVTSFLDTLSSQTALGALASASVASDENLWWDKEDIRKPKAISVDLPHIIHAGIAEGVLMGGNLETIAMLTGTDYLPDLQDSILFLEEAGGSLARLERHLVHLEQAKIFEQVRGLVFGRTYPLQLAANGRGVDDILRELGNRYSIPILSGIDCGHTTPMLTLPLGIKSRLDCDAGTISLLEPAVS